MDCKLVLDWRLELLSHFGVQYCPVTSPLPIPVVDLFAGPGGLGEGFSRVEDGTRRKVFKTVISIEKDPHARQTLRLRAFYRHFVNIGRNPPAAYIRVLKANTAKEKNDALRELAQDEAWKAVCEEIPEWKRGGKPSCELGPDNSQIHAAIRERLMGVKRWVLIGGPPCQAYSLVGRSRMRNHDGSKHDPRHFLYREYLGVIKEFEPTIFVMENVKGLNTAKVGGKPILPMIKRDLEAAGYDLCSIVDPEGLDFMVKSELFGVPQTRHRMIIVGVKKSVKRLRGKLLPMVRNSDVETVYDALYGLRPLMALNSTLSRASYGLAEKGAPFRECSSSCHFKSEALRNFISSRTSPLSGVLLNHEARSHMPEDLRRYQWWVDNATNLSSPKLNGKIPKRFLPKHSNSSASGATAFSDRFKVQVKDRPCGTITSHISKDGHYYIHYDRTQARSFSVREAARIQTFPDDYFFMGNRTQQYHQVGNAVPPYLAYQIGQRVWEALRG
jgi:DNA (cytosine-5)-methyltransferase 1